jgi:hypothetical protein
LGLAVKEREREEEGKEGRGKKEGEEGRAAQYLNLKSQISIGREGTQVVGLGGEINNLDTNHEALASNVADARNRRSTWS